MPSAQEIRDFLASKRPDAELQALQNSDDARRRKHQAEQWFGQPGLRDVMKIFRPPPKPSEWTSGLKDIAEWPAKRAEYMREYHKKIQPYFDRSFRAPKYLSMGGGVHAGIGVEVVGQEWGTIFDPPSFDPDLPRPPDYKPYIADYTSSWKLLGLSTGVDFGAGIDISTFAVWFADTDKIAGACNGVTLSMTDFIGVGATLYWTGQWGGVDGTEIPIGFSMTASEGIEEGAGLYLNFSWTDISKK